MEDQGTAVETATKSETTVKPLVPVAKPNRIGIIVNPNLKLVGDVTPFVDDPTRGWVQLEETNVHTKLRMGGLRSSLVEEKKTALYDGPVDLLKANAKVWKEGIPGRIVTKEFVFSDLPKEARKMDEEALARYEKKAGSIETGGTGLNLMKNGENIYHFKLYDPTGEMQDTKVEHDNSDELSDAARFARLERKEAKEKELDTRLDD